MRLETKILFILLHLFLLDTLWSQSNFPEWLNNPYDRYPKDRYLVALGEGYSRKNAEQDALGRMALIFKSNIKVTNSLYRKYEELIGDDDSYFNEKVNASDNVKISSDQSLLNVRFGESFVDDNGKNHVLAYINRFETINIYINKINSNTKEILFFYNKSKAYRTPIPKYAFARAAYEIAKINDNLVEKAKIIQPNSNLSSITLYNPIEIKHSLTQAAKNISFDIDVINDKKGVIKESLEQYLTNEGFIVRKNALLKINGIASFKVLDLPRKEVFLRWDMTLNVYDKFKSKILSSSKHGREGHITYNECELRCFNEMGNYISKEYGPGILEYFDRITLAK